MNNNTSVTDSSGNGRNGILVTDNGTNNKAVAGKLNNAFHADGNGDYLKVPYANVVSVNSSAFTVGMWVRHNTVADWQVYWQMYNDANTGDRITASSGDGGYISVGWDSQGQFDSAWADTGNNVVYEDRWFHIVWTYDGSLGGSVSSRFKIYVDGVDRTADFADTRAVADFTPTHIWFGTDRYQSYVNNFDGAMDEVFLFSRALSLSEVQSIYNRQTKVYKSSTGAFLSRIFDAANVTTWYSFLATPRSPYGKSGRAVGDETSSYSVGIKSSQLVSYIPLDEPTKSNNSTVVDLKTGLNGTLTTGDGTTNKSVSGQFGEALKFDGVNDLLSIPNTNNVYNWSLNSTRSWSFWVKQNTVPNYGECAAFVSQTTIGTSNNGFFLETCHLYGRIQIVNISLVVDGSNSLSFWTGNHVLPVNRWNHVVVTYDGSQSYTSRVKMYVNGVEEPLFDELIGTPNNTTTFSQPLVIGGSTAWGEFLNGSLDEIMIFNKVLSADEAKMLYARGVTRLKYQVRSCNDPACSGEDWMGPDGTTNTYFTDEMNTSFGLPHFLLPSSVPMNRYFQYRTIFETDDQNISPALRQISVDGFR